MRLESLGAPRLEELLPLVREYHAVEGIHMPAATRRAAVAGLLADSRLGAVWAIHDRAPWVGYVALTLGYSIEFRGRDAFIDELYVREPWRGRGIATAALGEVKAWAAREGVRALHLEVDRTNAAARTVYGRLGFALRERYSLMSVLLGETGVKEG